MARPTKHEVRYRNVGRPSVMTQEVLDKLEEGFSYTYTDEEACFHAGISVDTLYSYQRKNPEFIKRKEALKLKPNLSAKRVLVSKIEGDLNQARWWAEKKLPDFAPKVKVEGAVVHMHALTPGMEQAIEAYNNTRRLQLEAEIKEMP